MLRLAASRPVAGALIVRRSFAASSNPNPHMQRHQRRLQEHQQQVDQRIKADAERMMLGHHASSPLSTQVTKTHYVFFSLVALASLLGGASIVHNILQPDLTLPDLQKPATANPVAAAAAPAANTGGKK